MFTRYKTSVVYDDKEQMLRRCPICNGRARYMKLSKKTLFSSKSYYYVECGHCGLNTKVKSSIIDALNSWNGV